MCVSVDLLLTASEFASITYKQDHCARPRPRPEDNITGLEIHKICALCGIFNAISVLVTTANADDLEIRVTDGSRSLKATSVQ